MDLETFQTGTSEYGIHIKALFAGSAGSGKTLISSTFPHPFYASAEGGLMSVADRKVHGTKITSSGQLKQLREVLSQPAEVAMKLLKVPHPIETVIVDTVDEVQRILAKERLAAKKIETLDMGSWGWLGDQLRSIIRGFRNLEMNVVFTVHTKESRDETSGQVFYTPAIQGAVGGELPQYFDLSLLLRSELKTRVVGEGTERYVRRYLQTFPDPQHDWVKDRSGKLPPEIEVTFNDDYERIKGAIFGEYTSDWERAEKNTIEDMQKTIEQLGGSDEVVASSPLGVEAETSTVREHVEGLLKKAQEYAEEKHPPEETAVPEPTKPDPGMTEKVPEEDEGSTTEPEASDTVSAPEEGKTRESYSCSDCEETFDSFDQKELSEIMAGRVLCRVCYKNRNNK